MNDHATPVQQTLPALITNQVFLKHFYSTFPTLPVQASFLSSLQTWEKINTLLSHLIYVKEQITL